MVDGNRPFTIGAVIRLIGALTALRAIGLCTVQAVRNRSHQPKGKQTMGRHRKTELKHLAMSFAVTITMIVGVILALAAGR